MTKIIFDDNLLKAMSFFERLTGAKVKDCIMDDTSYIFVVEPGMIGKAVGKRGANVHKLQTSLNRKIKIVEFNPELVQFISNVIYPLRATEVVAEGDIVTITGPDSQTRGLLIGRNAKNLRNTESLVQRYFDIKEIKVI